MWRFLILIGSDLIHKTKETTSVVALHPKLKKERKSERTMC
jgi:hypothetical protein